MPQVVVGLPCLVWCMDVVVGRRHTVDQKLRYLFINLTVTRKYWHHRQPIFFPSYYGSWGILELFRQTKISILVCCAPHDKTNWTTIAKMPMTWHGGCIKKAFQMTLKVFLKGFYNASKVIGCCADRGCLNLRKMGLRIAWYIARRQNFF